MAKKNEWEQPTNPPPPLFTGQKEKNFVKQVTDETIERIIGQGIFYYPIDPNYTNFHPIYGEAVHKTFLPPIRVYALIEWNEFVTETGKYGVDKRQSITVHFHKRRLTEDQDIFVREGDFILYGSFYYEIVTLDEPKELFGQAGHKFEITAKCVRARKGLFDAT